MFAIYYETLLLTVFWLEPTRPHGRISVDGNRIRYPLMVAEKLCGPGYK